jgi:CelD/BcsL family acetyltransferase involved in cellulose biosynthesis
MISSWKLKVYQSWNEVNDPDFINKWMQWIDSASNGHVFFHPTIANVWVDTYRNIQDISPLYCVAECDGVTIFLPLVLWRRNWKNAFLRIIVPIGHSGYDYHDPVTTEPRPPEFMRSFWKLIEDQVFSGNMVHYDKINIQGFRFPCNEQWEEEESCPYTDLTRFKDYSEYLLKLKKNLRQDIGRQKRRLSEIGEITYKVFKASELADALEHLPAFNHAHSLRWPKAFKPNGFLQSLLNEGVPANLVHFSVLMIDATPISWHLGFRYKDMFYYYMPAFLEEYQTYSPSKIHLSKLIEECFTNSINIFDHLGGSENYKAGWATNIAHMYSFKRARNTLPTKIRLTAFNTMLQLKKIL